MADFQNFQLQQNPTPGALGVTVLHLRPPGHGERHGGTSTGALRDGCSPGMAHGVDV